MTVPDEADNARSQQIAAEQGSSIPVTLGARRTSRAIIDERVGLVEIEDAMTLADDVLAGPA